MCFCQEIILRGGVTMPVLPVVFRPTVESSAQKEEKLAREIRAAQTSNRNRPTCRERLDRFGRFVGDGFRRQ